MATNSTIGRTRIQQRIRDKKVVHVIEQRVRFRWREIEGKVYDNRFTAIAEKAVIDGRIKC